MKYNYTFFELYFSKFKFIRKMSKAFWVKHYDGTWVKFTDWEAKKLEYKNESHPFHGEYWIVEDYRK